MNKTKSNKNEDRSLSPYTNSDRDSGEGQDDKGGSNVDEERLQKEIANELHDILGVGETGHDSDKPDEDFDEYDHDEYDQDDGDWNDDGNWNDDGDWDQEEDNEETGKNYRRSSQQQEMHSSDVLQDQQVLPAIPQSGYENVAASSQPDETQKHQTYVEFRGSFSKKPWDQFAGKGISLEVGDNDYAADILQNLIFSKVEEEYNICDAAKHGFINVKHLKGFTGNAYKALLADFFKKGNVVFGKSVFAYRMHATKESCYCTKGCSLYLDRPARGSKTKLERSQDNHPQDMKRTQVARNAIRQLSSLDIAGMNPAEWHKTIEDKVL